MRPMPPPLAARLYAAGSLALDGDGFRFALDNRLAAATLTRIVGLRVDDAEVPLDALQLALDGTPARPARDVTPAAPAHLAASARAEVRARGVPLACGPHDLAIAVEVAPFGEVELRARDTLLAPPAAPPATASAATASAATAPAAPADAPARDAVDGPGGADGAAVQAHAPRALPRIPYRRDPALDHRLDAVTARQAYVHRVTGVRPTHVARFSFDLPETIGNIERLVGAAQVPLGLAGPLRVRGEHLDEEVIVPLATTEGTLVASYSRGMKALTRAGGARVTVSADAMQRAPVFAFDDARAARDFVGWVEANAAGIRAAAEATSRVAKLLYVEPYLAHRFAFLRFNYATGDAAGQNMVGKATLAACEWILARAPGIRAWWLESNFATDKKASDVNRLRTRGKRVTAEVTIPADVLREVLHVTPAQLTTFASVAGVSGFLSGASSNGLHVPNALAALFIATGQDVANVVEGAVSHVHNELRPDGALYLSLTIPSLIVATYGGGTALATQRECLEMLGCYGAGKVNRFAEIVAAVALAGELSLAAAIVSLDWVPAHERLGRNR